MHGVLLQTKSRHVCVVCLSSLVVFLCVPLSFDTPAKCNTSPSLANVTNSSLKILIQAQYDSRGQQTAQSLFVLLQTLMQYDTLSSIQVERKRAEEGVILNSSGSAADF